MTHLEAKETFLDDVKRIHPNLDFSETEYVKEPNKTKIICPVHGVFYKRPCELRKGAGCPKCTRIDTNKHNREKPLSFYLPRLPKLNYVDLDLNKPVLKSHKLSFLCEKHGIQSIYISRLLQGCACPKCGKEQANKQKLLTEDQALSLIPKDKLKNFKVDFPEQLYKITPITVTCLMHNETFTTDLERLIGQKYSCPKCAIEGVTESQRYTLGQYVKLSRKVHGDSYDYSKVVYTDSKTPVEIICKKHGSFFQRFTDHVNSRQGCPTCALGKTSSRWEEDFSVFIESKGFPVIRHYRDWWGQKEIDIYIPSLHLGFELNGARYHNVTVKPRSFHKQKSEQALKAGINLIHLWDIWGENKCLDIVSHKLGLSKKFHARKTHVRKIDQKTANTFYGANHLRGSVGTGFSFGAFLEDELIACMSFRKINSEGVELSRYASLKGTQLVGGFSKLLAHFEKQNTQFDKVISWAYRDICPDPSKSVYAKTGFALVGNSLQMFYYDSRTERVVNRQQLMKHKLSKLWEDFVPELTEKENCERHGYLQCFDSGIWKFEKPINIKSL